MILGEMDKIIGIIGRGQDINLLLSPQSNWNIFTVFKLNQQLTILQSVQQVRIRAKNKQTEKCRQCM